MKIEGNRWGRKGKKKVAWGRRKSWKLKTKKDGKGKKEGQEIEEQRAGKIKKLGYER